MSRKHTSHFHQSEGRSNRLEIADETVNLTVGTKQSRRPKLDAEKLRKMAGCEHLTLAEAEEVCRTMYSLARLFYWQLVGEQPLPHL